uniref:Uncharacterized protein n=1 Tax=Arundo donax TaxID=35708 RepID=A0A0A9GPJ3_ARUDO
MGARLDVPGACSPPSSAKTPDGGSARAPMAAATTSWGGGSLGVVSGGRR